MNVKKNYSNKMNKIDLKKVKTRQQNKNKESINSTNCHKNENVKKNKKMEN